MSDQERLASSVGRSTSHRSITFEVSDEFLRRDYAPGADPPWSAPVVFRFEQRDEGHWDLVMRLVRPGEEPA